MSGFGSGSDSALAIMSFHLPSPLMIDEESTEVIEKQGIVSILRCDGGRTKAASLRRTLSADMSSKKWLAQNGFSPLKKIASSEHLAISGVDSSDGEDEKDGVRRQGQGQADVWSSILMQKAEEDATKLPPPYVHPLVKKSASSLLSEKSLEVCTESLGSETGSDGFSSYTSSEAGDVDEEKEEEQLVPLAAPPQQQKQQLFFSEKEETVVVKNNNYSASKKLQARSFPPPLPSLARSDGPSVHMHSRRENGRLVLEAVSVPANNFFHAQRQDGRLLLTLLNSPSEESVEAKGGQVEGKFEEYQDVFDIFDEKENEGKEEVDEEEEEDMGEIVKFEKENENKEMRKATKMMSSRFINVHRSALSMKKPMGLENMNTTWTNKFNKGVKLVEAEEEDDDLVVVEQQQSNPLPQSLPPLARLIPSATGAAAASFNAYEYFWRTKPAANLIKPLTHQSPPLKTNNKVMVSNNCPKVYEQQEMVLLRANKALVPSLRGCKEPRRSLLLWEPYCIATS